MTQAFNLAQLANNLNTSGQLDATDGLNGLVANANLASSGSASSSTYLRGDRVWASLPALGKVLQVQSNFYSAPYTYTSNQSQTTIAFNVSITPSSTSSRILVMLFTSYYCAGTTYKLRLFRNGTQIGQGDANGSNQQGWMYMGNHSDGNQAYQSSGAYVDSPSTTSAISYTTAVINDNAATIFFNRPESGGTGVTEGKTSTTMLAIEIGA